jgi:hypothetical protein
MPITIVIIKNRHPGLSCCAMFKNRKLSKQTSLLVWKGKKKKDRRLDHFFKQRTRGIALNYHEITNGTMYMQYLDHSLALNYKIMMINILESIKRNKAFQYENKRKTQRKKCVVYK